MSKSLSRDVKEEQLSFVFSNGKSVGEIWIDQAGNECFYRSNGTISCRTVNNEPSMAVQYEKDSCDINKIVERLGLKERPISAIAMTLTQSGLLKPNMGSYGDFTGASDLHDALLRIQEAEDTFMELPASIRSLIGS